MHESEKWKWSRSVVSDSSRPHGLQPTRLLRPWDSPGKSAGVGCRWQALFRGPSLSHSHMQSHQVLVPSSEESALQWRRTLPGFLLQSVSVYFSQFIDWSKCIPFCFQNCKITYLLCACVCSGGYYIFSWVWQERGKRKTVPYLITIDQWSMSSL